MPPFPVAWRHTWAEAFDYAYARAKQTGWTHWVRKYDGEWRIGFGDPH